MGVDISVVYGVGVIVPPEHRQLLEKDENRFPDGLNEWLYDVIREYPLLMKAAVGSYYGGKDDWTDIIAIERLSGEKDVDKISGGFFKDMRAIKNPELTEEESSQLKHLCGRLALPVKLEDIGGILWH